MLIKRKLLLTLTSLIIFLILFIKPLSAAPANNPIFATVEWVEGEIQQLLNVFNQHESQSQTDFNFINQRVDDLKERVEFLESLVTPTPTDTPEEPGTSFIVSNNTWKFSTSFNERWLLRSFDDSSWLTTEAPSGGQCNPSVIGLLINENGALPMSEESVIWITGFFRKKFNLTSNNYEARARLVLDDDGDFYVNGSHVLSDHDNHVAGTSEVDISPFLIKGENVVALKVIDSAGGCQHAQVEIELIPLSLTSTTPVIFAQNRPASFETEFVELPKGYRTMTFNVSTTDFLINWAPAIEVNSIPYEQHRFNCGGFLNCPEVTIPIISDGYQFRTGTSGGNITAVADLNPEPNSQSLLFGKKINYPFTSDIFETDGFNSIIISAGGGDNPQNLTGISLQRFEGGSWVEKQHVNCDGGAECPLEQLPVLGGEYKVVLQGNGTGAVVGALLRK